MKISKILILVGMGCFVLSCSTPAGEAAYDGSMELEVVDDFLYDFTSGDIDGALEYLHEDYRLNGPALADSITRDEWATAWRQNFETDIDEIEYERVYRHFLEVTIADNPLLAGYWVLEWGRFTINYMDSTAATFWWHGAFRFDEDKILLTRIWLDNKDIEGQRKVLEDSLGSMLD